MKTKISKPREQKPVTWNMTTEEARFFAKELDRIFEPLNEKGLAL